MRSSNLAVIVGSLRRESLNRELSNALGRLASADRSFVHLSNRGLTPVRQDHGLNSIEVVSGLKAALIAAQGWSFASTEFMRAIPVSLKNAIEHASPPFGPSAWTGAGMLGTAIAQQHLRHCLVGLDFQTAGQPEASGDARHDLTDGAGPGGVGSKLLLQAWIDRYVAWIRKRVG